MVMEKVKKQLRVIQQVVGNNTTLLILRVICFCSYSSVGGKRRDKGRRQWIVDRGMILADACLNLTLVDQHS